MLSPFATGNHILSRHAGTFWQLSNTGKRRQCALDCVINVTSLGIEAQRKVVTCLYGLAIVTCLLILPPIPQQILPFLESATYLIQRLPPPGYMTRKFLGCWSSPILVIQIGLEMRPQISANRNHKYCRRSPLATQTN